MSSYVHGTTLSYRDFLQAQSFESSFKSEISIQTKSIVASNEELHNVQISVSDAISGGFAQLSFALERIDESISELNATFQWGFSELLTVVGRVNKTLDELVRISKTPAQTWAYEQFEIARDAYRQELYDDAIEYLDRAINGHAGNTGYRLEYRFHYLLGTNRVGSYKNHLKDIVNLIAAECAFLDAAKYALRDEPKESGRAFLAAGWAAYCQGKMPEATQYTERAVALHPELAEAHFQAAKIGMHIGSPHDALAHLMQAIELDRGYAIKAATDRDFQRYETNVNDLLDELRQKTKMRAETTLKETQQKANKTENKCVQEYFLMKYSDTEIFSAKREISDAVLSARHDTYFGYLDALSFCENAKENLLKACENFIDHAKAEVELKLSKISKDISVVQSADLGWKWITIFILFIVVTFTLGFTQCSRVYEANTQQEKVREAAENRMLAEVRSKGYDPEKITIEDGRRLGYRLEDLPPKNIGSTSFGTWIFYVFWGLILSYCILVIGPHVQNKSIINRLEREKSNLQYVLTEFQKLEIE